MLTAQALKEMRQSLALLRRDYYLPERYNVLNPPGPYIKPFLGWKVKLVDGAWIRSALDTDFFGGNPARYAYIPLGELWVVGSDDDYHATLLHEFIEAEIMICCGCSYNNSHDYATFIEKEFRKESAPLTEKLAEEKLLQVMTLWAFELIQLKQ